MKPNRYLIRTDVYKQSKKRVISNSPMEVWSRFGWLTLAGFEDMRKEQATFEIYHGTVGAGQALYCPMAFILVENVGESSAHAISKRMFVKGDLFGLEWYGDFIKTQAAANRMLGVKAMQELHEKMAELNQ